MRAAAWGARPGARLAPFVCAEPAALSPGRDRPGVKLLSRGRRPGGAPWPRRPLPIPWKVLLCEVGRGRGRSARGFLFPAPRCALTAAALQLSVSGATAGELGSPSTLKILARGREGSRRAQGEQAGVGTRPSGCLPPRVPPGPTPRDRRSGGLGCVWPLVLRMSWIFISFSP